MFAALRSAAHAALRAANACVAAAIRWALFAFRLTNVTAEASTSACPAPTTLLLLPAELLSVILSSLDTRSLARFAATCRPLWLDAPTPASAPRDIGPVEAELRLRAKARGLETASSLPDFAPSWVPYLLKRDRRDAQRRQAPLTAGIDVSIFVDEGGRLLTCGRDSGGILRLGHAEDPDADPDGDTIRRIGPPTPVPSMQDRRIVSVATGGDHCLALTAQGEVYSWGDGEYGALGHGDENSRAVPSRIESIDAGIRSTCAAVNAAGSLFTWGRAMYMLPQTMSNGLGYALESQAESQLTPKQVEALSQDRVVGVSAGQGFTLAVTDAGAVFSFGYSREGALGHGPLEAEVLPRRIDALAQTGRRFVAVAAVNDHALALTEEGELYGWGAGCANGHGSTERTPRQVAALIGERIKLVDARHDASCAVTEKGELFTWSSCCSYYNLGHGVNTPQDTPKRVEGLVRTRVAAAVIGGWHTLAADEDGVVWGFGQRNRALGLDDGTITIYSPVEMPTPIPTLRVRALKSP